MKNVQGVDSLLSGWETAGDDVGEAVSAFRRWRGDHLSRHREFAGLTQREMGEKLGLSQAAYTKLEQANSWSAERQEQVCTLLMMQRSLLRNRGSARTFLGREGGLTYVRLYEALMDRWGDASERPEVESVFPAEYLANRLNEEQECHRHDERPAAVFAFLSDPVANDLDQATKRWLEQLLDLEHGALADAEYYKEKRADRQHRTREMRRHLLANVERLLEERGWTATDLALRSGLPRSEIANNDGSLLFQPLRMPHLSGLSLAFDIDPALLLMENGADMQQVSAISRDHLPKSVRRFMSWLQGIATATMDEPGNAGVAVTAMLPMIQGMLVQLQKDAVQKPEIADAMKGLFHAYYEE